MCLGGVVLHSVALHTALLLQHDVISYLLLRLGLTQVRSTSNVKLHAGKVASDCLHVLASKGKVLSSKKWHNTPACQASITK